MRIDLAALPLEAEDGALRVVIETPRGATNKYGYNPDLGGFELHSVLPLGTEYPFDFGFFPSTLSEDGDPLDVLVLSDSGLDVGTLLSARLIGVLEFEDKKKGADPERNDRLIAVPTCTVAYEKIHALDDLPEPLIKQLESFFERDAFFKGKQRRLLGRKNGKTARKLLDEAAARCRNGKK